MQRWRIVKAWRPTLTTFTIGGVVDLKWMANVTAGLFDEDQRLCGITVIILSLPAMSSYREGSRLSRRYLA